MSAEMTKKNKGYAYTAIEDTKWNREPAEFKHIIKRRKRNQLRISK
jgi:hypothetical protein